jgi:hypothetical protein
MLLRLIGELRAGTSPRPVRATGLIVSRSNYARLVGTASCLRSILISRTTPAREKASSRPSGNRHRYGHREIPS